MSDEINQPIPPESVPTPSHQMSKTKSGFLFFFGIITTILALIMLISLGTVI